ncbi:class I SAM-dependent methyltransferase [Altererythrobacter sp. BO-6]|uniref:class I SAM-dependent methyltransferase n=1 Tax=Altererythrobacter sp. BO-6 TaxID=2604537 RepID=UPI0013E17978|nr:class I SAM-dependent methyltransferase [Altererythrobacter sp. BO-6]QIG55184.1 class I SAM-dependent methyltransferase [Altererythrobacter sp. BO-6]
MAGVDTQEWQGRVGKSWAAEWQRTDRSFSQLTEELKRQIFALEFSHVLDIGCGAGELSLAVAAARPNAQVVGVDVSPDLIEAARARARSIENLHFELADAATWHPDDGAAPDLLMSRHGVMFFDDPVAAFANLRCISAPGACMIFSCFREIDQNPFFREAGRLVPPDPAAPPGDPHAPGPFAFADKDRVERILAEAGWRDIRFEAFDFDMIAGAGEHPVQDAVGYFSRIGPAARALADIEGAEEEQMLARIRELSEANLRHGKVALGAGVWIVSARHS